MPQRIGYKNSYTSLTLVNKLKKYKKIIRITYTHMTNEKKQIRVNFTCTRLIQVKLTRLIQVKVTHVSFFFFCHTSMCYLYESYE